MAVLKKSAVKNTIVSGMPMAKYSFTVLESIHRCSLFFLAVLQIQTFLAFFDPVYNYSRSESAALLLTEGFCFEQFKRYLLSNITYIQNQTPENSKNTVFSFTKIVWLDLLYCTRLLPGSQISCVFFT